MKNISWQQIKDYQFTCYIFNKKAEIIASSQKEFPQIFPKSGWVEHDANAIWNSIQSVIAEVFIESGNKNLIKIASIGITNQT